jgi:hypothetical protein
MQAINLLSTAGAHSGIFFEPDFGRFGRLVLDPEIPST